MTKRRLNKSVVKDDSVDHCNKCDNTVKKYCDKQNKKMKKSDETNDKRTESTEKNKNEDNSCYNDREMILLLQEDSKRTM